jgi:hypothetical protein
MKGKVIIGISILVWIAVLIYTNFFSENEYKNVIIIILGFIVTMCSLNFGFEELKKK